LQLLFLNLVTDVFPAFALALDEGEADVLDKPPRDPREPILGRPQWMEIVVQGLVITLATLAALVLAGAMPGAVDGAGQTAAFLTLALAQLWHVFNMREQGSSLLDNEITRNAWVWAALAVCIGLVALAAAMPALARILGLAPLSALQWALVVGLSLVPVLAGGLSKALAKRLAAPAWNQTA
jgi:Ca2+-transporting ATPase